MNLARHATASALLDAAENYLVAREAEHNLILGILGTLRDQPEVYPEPPYLATVTDEAVVLVAVRTPPMGLILSELGAPDEMVPDVLSPLIDDLLRDSPDLPGVLGPKLVAGSFAARWATEIGCSAPIVLAERIYRLSHVCPARPAPGSLRRATGEDRQLLRAWVLAFREEALPGVPQPDVDPMVDRLIRGEGRAAYLWEADGRAVSLVGAGSPTPHGIRIGPVYTPPAERKRGYASALTAAVSRQQFEEGRRYCFLFTDLANPTSNRIYQSIGYEPVTDVNQHRFELGSSPRGT